MKNVKIAVIGGSGLYDIDDTRVVDRISLTTPYGAPSGDITIVDVSDVEKPKLVEKFTVPGNPGRLVVHNNSLVIPNGYEGLWVDDKHGE